MQLGVRHYVIISNECKDAPHAELLRVASSAPCSPRITFIHSFRCDAGFQIRGYTEAVRVLIDNGEPPETRVGFWDVDEFLVVTAPPVAGAGSAVDALFEQSPSNEPQWQFDVKPFGPGLHHDRPVGFVPANFVLGSDLPSSKYGAYPKSVCSLGAMREAFLRQEGPFYQKEMQPRVRDNWPHHCLDKSIIWRVPRSVARLNHYATRHERRWMEKCVEQNPTFSGNSRNHTGMCDLENGGMPEFFKKMNNGTDLLLFQQLDRHAAIPEHFLAHAWPDALKEQVAGYCRSQPQGALQGAALSLCAESLQLSPAEATLRGREPYPRSSCLCTRRISQDEWVARYRCQNHGGRDDDGSYCWMLCCRGPETPGLKRRNISWTPAEARKHGKG